MGHQQSRRHPEDVPQPIRHASVDLVITFDGRLDNRPDLVRELCAGEKAFRTPSDCELTLAAYERWGEECPARLLGDFAFAVWDGPRRSLFCARDGMGVKPLYYAIADDVFVWASDIRQILASGLVPIAPNEGMAGEYLSFHIQSISETLYQHVMRLPAGHTIAVSAEAARVRRYWRLEPSTEIHYATDAEFADHCREVMTEATRCRLPRDTRTGWQA